MALDEQVPSIVSVAVLVATAALGPELAVAVGGYGVILLGWFGGVMWGVWRMPPVPRGQLVAFVLVSLVGTIGVTVSATEMLTHLLRATVPWASSVQPAGLLFPVAFVLPAIGHNWIDVARWVWGLRSRVTARRNDGSAP
jgi:hypothetical protein